MNAEAAAEAIRASGLRLSAARRLVLEALYRAESPVKAEEIASGLDGNLPRSDLASVYRNLETFEQLLPRREWTAEAKPAVAVMPVMVSVVHVHLPSA